MKIEPHQVGESRVAAVISTDVVIKTVANGVALLGDLYYQGYDAIIIDAKNITPDFFDLRTGMAGEILQKFSNYRMRLAIVGNFAPCTDRSIRDFMVESNKTGHINCVSSPGEALDRLSKG